MEITFCVQTGWRRIEAMTGRLASAVHHSGGKLFDFSVTDSLPDRLLEETAGPRFLYGSTQMVRLARADRRVCMDLFFEPDAFDQRTWVAERKADMLNGEGENLTWAELRAATATEELFVRPTFEQKAFSGALVGPANAATWFDTEEARTARLNSESLVWVARPKSIVAEYRFIVLDHQLVTGSRYRMDGALSVAAEVPQEVWEAAARLAEGWSPARLVAMDVCTLVDGRHQVVEWNCIHSSGMYLCDLAKLVKAVENAYPY